MTSSDRRTICAFCASRDIIAFIDEGHDCIGQKVWRDAVRGLAEALREERDMKLHHFHSVKEADQAIHQQEIGGRKILHFRLRALNKAIIGGVDYTDGEHLYFMCREDQEKDTEK